MRSSCRQQLSGSARGEPQTVARHRGILEPVTNNTAASKESVAYPDTRNAPILNSQDGHATVDEWNQPNSLASIAGLVPAGDDTLCRLGITTLLADTPPMALEPKRREGEASLAEPSRGQTSLEQTAEKSIVVRNRRSRLTEQARIEERNRKGRERSLRTRRRNAARLKILQDNCSHLFRENGVLRQVASCIRENADRSVISSLLRTLAIYRRNRPPPHVLSSQGSARVDNQANGHNHVMSALAVKQSPCCGTCDANWKNGNQAPNPQEEFASASATLDDGLAKAEATSMPHLVTAVDGADLTLIKTDADEACPPGEIGDTTSTNGNSTDVADFSNVGNWPRVEDAVEPIAYFDSIFPFATIDFDSSVGNLEELPQLTIDDVVHLIGGKEEHNS